MNHTPQRTRRKTTKRKQQRRKPLRGRFVLLGAAVLLVQGEILTTLINHANAYLKHSGDVRSTGEGMSLVYPSVAQSIIEVQDLSFAALFPYFHPWMEAAVVGLAGFVLVLFRRPGALQM